MAEATVAFIGGSGLYDMDGLTNVEERRVDTPFGPPSDSIVVGDLGATRVAFLPRHGQGHRISPTEIPMRANIYALKSLGVERIVSISAVGSLKEGVKPLEVVIPDQLIDRTLGRVRSFFGEGIVGHIAFADPFCSTLSDAVWQATERHELVAHRGGVCVVIEGPQFSTRAESELYRSWGASIIGMTALPEAKLAREAEICYATMAMVTDYDTWHSTEESVSVELIVANLLKNVAGARAVVKDLVPLIPVERECDCASAMKDAIITRPDRIPESARARLGPIVGKYLEQTSEVR